MNDNKFIPTRRSLLSRLRNWGNQESWREFFDMYWHLLYSVATKAGLSDADAEDAVQETIIAVARKMPGFQYDPSLGSFKGWLLQITRRRIADQLRKRYRTSSPDGKDSVTPTLPVDAADAADVATPALEAIWEEEWRDHLRQTALERIKRRIRLEQFQMFELAVLKGWPTGKVAQALGVTVVQVYMARHRVGNLVKKELQRLERNLI
jgi:RNA polymerase sigma-70 factor (ECF subfamily)